MDQNLVYAKTPIGDEAVRQSTRVVQRNLRMMLVQVDGKLTVAELSAKLGDPKMVERSLQELEDGGFIAPILEAVSAWQETQLKQDRMQLVEAPDLAPLDSGKSVDSVAQSSSSSFSSFGKPILPVHDVSVPSEPPQEVDYVAPEARPQRAYGPLLFGLFGFVLVVAVASVFPVFALQAGDRGRVGADMADAGQCWRCSAEAVAETGPPVIRRAHR